MKAININQVAKGAALSLATFAFAWSMPAQAQAETSFCGIDRLPAVELLEIDGLYRNREDKLKLPKKIAPLITACQEKVKPAMAGADEFLAFVFDDIMAFSFRYRLISQGYDMDRFDTKAQMRCNHDHYAKEEVSTDDTNWLDAVISDVTPKDKGLGKRDRDIFVDYAIAQSFRWLDGQALGLLPACDKG